MALHMIVLSRPNDAVASRIQETHPDNYEITPNCYLVQSKDITQKIAAAVGIEGREPHRRRIRSRFQVERRLLRICFSGIVGVARPS